MAAPSPARALRPDGGRRRPPPPVPAGPGERTAIVAGAAVLVVGTFLQARGRILPETKLDLLLEPGRFIGRALHLWDPSASFGQIQNQAAGYLLPMGPAYWLGRTAGLAPWIVQRLWIGGLLAVGFWGVARLARALGVGTPASRIVGAAAYALGAASLTLVAFRSGTQVPVYALPWVLVPLVEADRHGRRRAAARSALAVALMGGVNGTATGLVLLVPALWFVTRRRGTGRWRLAGWWAVGVVLATTWWTVPLVIQGRFGYAFTDFTESATLTTAVSSGTEVLRGTGNWLAYLTSQNQLWLPGGWELIANRIAVGGGLAVAAAGLAGLARRDQPERLWLSLSALAGATVMVAGYHGPLGSPVWSSVRSLLDGPLVPLRNVTKAQPVLALPVALGAAHLLGRAQRAVARSRARRGPAPTTGRWRAVRPASAAVVLVGLATVGAAGLPFLHGRVPVDGTFTRVPAYWEQAGTWLDAHGHDRRSVVVPGSAFGEYTWGRPLDDPLTSTTDQPLAVRDIVPLGSNGTTRLLDGVEDQLQSGRISAGLVTVLRRAGVGFLVERNDLDPVRTDALPPGQVHALLAAELGRPAASFGPMVDSRLGPAHLRPRQAPLQVRAVEIWALGGSVPRVTAYPLGGTAVVGGEPEALYELAAADALGARATVLAGDPDVPTGGVGTGAPGVAADVSRRRDVAFGDVRFTASYTLTADEPAPGTDQPPTDRLVVPGDAHLARAVQQGAATVRASSYGETDLVRLPADQPWAAFDGDPATAWRPSLGAPASLDHTLGQWVELTLDQPRDLRRAVITVPVGAGRSRPTELTVTTDSGTSLALVGGPTVELALPAGTTRHLRITLTGVGTGVDGLGAPGIAEVAVPGLDLARPVAVPATGAPGGDRTIVLARDHGDPFARQPWPEDAALDRRIELPRTGAYAVTGTVVARPGPALDRLLAGLEPAGGAEVRATSSWNGLPAFAPWRAFDGDPGTGWVAAPDDPDPALTVSWPAARTVDSLTVRALGPPATEVRAVVLTSDSGESRTVGLGAPGRPVPFAPLTARTLTVRPARTTGAHPATAAEPGQATGLAELQLGGGPVGPVAPAPTTPFELPCGSGPPVAVGGTTVPTSVRGTVADLVDVAPIPFTACGDAPRLAAGTRSLRTGIDRALQVEQVRLTAPGADPTRRSGPARTVTVSAWGSEHRIVRIGAGGRSLVALGENANPGWTASLDGRSLTSTRVDGWRQAWIVPAGGRGTITIDFAPGSTYRAGLAIGFLLLLVLLVAGLWPSRRETAHAALPPLDRLPAALAVAAAVGVGFLAGGWAALLVVPLLLLPGRREVLPAVVGAAVVGAAVVVLITPGGLPQDQNGTFSPAAQGLSVLALVAVAVSLVPGDLPLPLRRRRGTGDDGAPADPPAGPGGDPDDHDRPADDGPADPVGSDPGLSPGAGSTPSTRPPTDRHPPR